MKKVAAGILVLFLLYGIGTAESASSGKDLQNFDSVLGKWQNAEESRETPNAPWVKGSSEWEFSWMPGGKVIQAPGRIGAGGTEVHFLQVYGYDVVNDALVSWAFDSDGTRCRMTSGGWDFVDDPVMRNANPVGVDSATETCRSHGSWIPRKCSDCVFDLLANWSRERGFGVRELPNRIRQFDVVDRLPPSCQSTPQSLTPKALPPLKVRSMTSSVAPSALSIRVP